AFSVESHALRPSQTAVKHRNCSVRINLVHRVKAGGRGPGYKQVSLGANCQMIRRNAGLDGRKHKNLAVPSDLENRSAAISYVKILVLVECNPCCHTHALRVGRHGPVGSDFIDGTLKAR